jgi:hypothetical protein
VDQLKRAFQGIPGLTQADAAIHCKDAFGIVVRSFPSERARALQAALSREGVETEVVEDASLPIMPQVRHVSRLDCTPDALLIYDPLGRNFPLEWKNIGLIAAGQVAVSEFNQFGKEHVVPVYTGRGVKLETVIENEFREQRQLRLLLEIVIRGGVLRYCVTADHTSHLLFQYLGARRTKNLPEDFTMLVRDMIQAAPHATLNRGAVSLRDNPADPFFYPAKSSFYNEIIWLLWQSTSSKPS